MEEVMAGVGGLTRELPNDYEQACYDTGAMERGRGIKTPDNLMLPSLYPLLNGCSLKEISKIVGWRLNISTVITAYSPPYIGRKNLFSISPTRFCAILALMCFPVGMSTTPRQLCNLEAPFADANGEPYLEIHHIIWLSDGGADTIENTVALCPNGHRKMHIPQSADDVEKLLESISKR